MCYIMFSCTSCLLLFLLLIYILYKDNIASLYCALYKLSDDKFFQCDKKGIIEGLNFCHFAGKTFQKQLPAMLVIIIFLYVFFFNHYDHQITIWYLVSGQNGGIVIVSVVYLWIAFPLYCCTHNFYFLIIFFVLEINFCLLWTYRHICGSTVNDLQKNQSNI